MIVTATAPGKLVLSGEYAVLAGAPALVLAVERRMRVTLRPGRGGARFTSHGFAGSSRHRLADLVEGQDLPASDPAALPQHVLHAIVAAGHALPPAPGDLDFEIDSRAGYEGGAKLGLGTSAAVCVATSAALLALIDVPAGESLAIARAAHARAQGGRGSGLDVASAYHGGLIRFERPPGREPGIAPAVTRLPFPRGLRWLAVWTRASADTVDYLARFDAWRSGGVPPALAALAAAAGTVAGALPDPGAFVRELRAYTDRLAAFDAAAGLGIFAPVHRRLRALAGPGVVYKPCGAGGGDLGVACAEDPAALAAFGVAAADAGYLPLALELSRHGVDVSITR